MTTLSAAQRPVRDGFASMPAVVLLGPGRLAIQEVPVPGPGRDEVLAQVRAVSICGTDVHMVDGAFPGRWPPRYPFIPGHEWAGDIVALGPGAERYGWQVGDRVAGTSHDACGACQQCVQGRYNLCDNTSAPGLHKQYGHSVDGAAAAYTVHGIKAIFALPPSLSYEQGAVLDPASIALHVANRGLVSPGDTVAITGGGAIGLLAGEAALVRGAARVIILEPNPRRAAKAEDMGFEVAGTGDAGAAEVRARTGGRGADVALECAGVPTAVRVALAMLRRGGRCAAVGIPAQDADIPMRDVVLNELDLVGCRASAGEMHHVIPLVAADPPRIRVDKVITHRFPLTAYSEALAMLSDPNSGAIKIVLKP